MGKYGKNKLKKYCTIQTPWPIGVSHDYLFSFKLVFISKINAMFTWALKPNKMPQHRLIRLRNVGSLTFCVILIGILIV
jgi:hypothetical protein